LRAKQSDSREHRRGSDSQACSPQSPECV